MKLYRKFARSRKGISSIFGGLFFIIFILMGFNLMLWAFVQYDAYNNVVSTMSLRDQQAKAEDLVPTNPGVANSTASSFNIVVNNLGIAVSIARIYIVNVNPTGQCQVSNPCIVDPSPASPGFTNGNVREGEIFHYIHVTTGGGLAPLYDGNAYKIVLASTRGRIFAFYYPWPQVPPGGGGNNNLNFQTNIGPLTIYFYYNSFNFTQGSQTVSQPAWVMPDTNVVVWVKVSNTDPTSDVKIRAQSAMLFEPYTAGGVGAYTVLFVSGKATLNPSSIQAYDENNAASFYDLTPANPNGSPTVNGTTIIKFGSKAVGSSTAQGFPNTSSYDIWLVFIGFYYNYQGHFQGQTIPFVAAKTCHAYPASSCY